MLTVQGLITVLKLASGMDASKDVNMLSSSLSFL